MEPASGMHQAIKTATEAVKDIYQDEEISNIELEEIEATPSDWILTVGFDRKAPLAILGGVMVPRRTLKRVVVNRETGEFKSMKIREPEVDQQ